MPEQSERRENCYIRWSIRVETGELHTVVFNRKTGKFIAGRYEIVLPSRQNRMS